VLGLKERASVFAHMLRPKKHEVIWGRKNYTLRTFIVRTLSIILGRKMSESRNGPDMFQACGGDQYKRVFIRYHGVKPMDSCRGDMNREVKLKKIYFKDLN
jgi:hypothetical protein